jgi:hypothetical protein
VTASLPGRLLVAAFGTLLAWQTASSIGDLVHEAGSSSLADRLRALTWTESERIEAAVVWSDLYRRIEDGVPRDGIIVFCIPLSGDPARREPERITATHFFDLVPLLYPRRFFLAMKPATSEAIEDWTRTVRRSQRPVFLVDMKSGFPLPRGMTQVATGSSFDLWRVDR